MNKIIFEDSKGNKQLLEVGNFCNVTLRVQDGKVVHVDCVESKKMIKID